MLELEIWWNWRD